jgi:hypothetical protein
MYVSHVPRGDPTPEVSFFTWWHVIVAVYSPYRRG